MINKLFSVLSKIRNSSKLDTNELTFVSCAKRAEFVSNGDVVLVQMPIDYYYLAQFHRTVVFDAEFSQMKIIGYWPYNLLMYPKDKNRVLGIIKYAYSWALYRGQKNKWKKLYSTMGVEEVLEMSTDYWSKINAFLDAIRIFRKLRSKSSLEKLEYDGILIGDLIYDSYLRFNSSATVDLKSLKLLCVIAKAMEASKSINKWIMKHNFYAILNSYSTYIHHGIVVRIFLKNNIKVYTDGIIGENFKLLEKNDYHHTKSHQNYLKYWNKNFNNESNLSKAKDLLSSRFTGKIDSLTRYMRKSAYLPLIGVSKINQHFDCIVFLHDFVDSPHIYRSMIFSDFWVWAIDTLNFLQDLDCRVAVKPHPNQRPESHQFVNQLKTKFSNFIWLDAEVSNLDIFQSGVKFGLSVYGTVLYEMAYFGVLPISAGDHPAVDFNIALNPKNRSEYFYLLENWKSLTLPTNVKEEIYAFYYMHAFFNQSSISPKKGPQNLRFLDPDNSESLLEYLQLVKSD